MLAEIGLGGCFVGGAIVLGWLGKVHRADCRRARDDDMRRRREEGDRDREEIDRLSHRIGSAIRSAGVESFRIGPYARSAGIAGDLADRAGRLLYLKAARRAVDGCAVSDAGRRGLVALAGALAIDGPAASLLEDEAKGDRFRAEAARAASGGLLTAGELSRLEALRRSLGLGEDAAAAILGEDGRPMYFWMIERAVALGRVAPATRATADRLRAAIFPGGIPAGEDRARADGLYRRALDGALRAGFVGDDGRELLAWMKAELRPTRGAVEDAERLVVRAIRLSRFRSGCLPSVETRVLLGSGETCHYQGACDYPQGAGRGSARHSGTLLVTSEKVRFLSPKLSFVIPPPRIMDVVVSGRALHLSLETRQGSVVFVTEEPEEVEAILVGVVRLSKFAESLPPELPGRAPTLQDLDVSP